MKKYLDLAARDFRVSGGYLLVFGVLGEDTPDRELSGYQAALGSHERPRAIVATQLDRRVLERTFRALCVRELLRWTLRGLARRLDGEAEALTRKAIERGDPQALRYALDRLAPPRPLAGPSRPFGARRAGGHVYICQRSHLKFTANPY
jgi:hypothetical protein